jgi:hypothetical protein
LKPDLKGQGILEDQSEMEGWSDLGCQGSGSEIWRNLAVDREDWLKLLKKNCKANDDDSALGQINIVSRKKHD